MPDRAATLRRAGGPRRKVLGRDSPDAHRSSSNPAPEKGTPPMNPAKATVEELIRRQEAGDETVLDDLVAVDFVNHAAGLQGREGLRKILQTIDADLGPLRFEQHHLVAEGDVVVQH